MIYLLVDWVELSFVCSTVCPILPGLLGIWQKRLGRWARRWNTQIKVNLMNHLVGSSIEIAVMESHATTE